MFLYHKCFPLNDIFINGKIPLSQFHSYINKFPFQYQKDIKEYWIHNTKIISDKKSLNYYLWEDIQCHLEGGWICQEYTIKQIPSFQFYQTDSEEVYSLYEAQTNEHLLQIYKYSDYFLFNIKTDKQLTSSELELFYI